MKHYLVLGLTLCAAVVLTGCKSKESAYRQAYEKAKAQESVAVQQETQDVAVTPIQPAQPVQQQPVYQQPVQQQPVQQQQTVAVQPVVEDHSDVRTIPGGVTVVNGDALQAYSVVVGSFVTQANAEGLMATLGAKGYPARVVKTNETINGHTGWFRVIASSFADKASAAQSRDELRATYPGAWLLYNK